MRALWVDPGNGCAGDMLLAALLDAGADLDVVRAGLARLAVEPIAVEPAVVRRHGFRALLANVGVVDAAVQRALPDIVKLLDPLPSPVRDFALATFTRLADAEARVHGIPVEQVHFHEVGALDAVADVVGCALALDDLGLLARGVTRDGQEMRGHWLRFRETEDAHFARDGTRDRADVIVDGTA